jgi:hypothetical protein
MCPAARDENTKIAAMPFSKSNLSSYDKALTHKRKTRVPDDIDVVGEIVRRQQHICGWMYMDL